MIYLTVESLLRSISWGYNEFFLETLRKKMKSVLTSHVESHFGAGWHGRIGVRWMNGNASDRLAVTWSLGQNLANTVGRPSARIIYLGRVYLRPQRPHLGLAHVPAYRPENLHFQWLFRNNSYSLPFNILPSSSASSSGRARLALSYARTFPINVTLSLFLSLALPSRFPNLPTEAHRRRLFRVSLFGNLGVLLR